jgi:O-antigen polymerase
MKNPLFTAEQLLRNSMLALIAILFIFVASIQIGSSGSITIDSVDWIAWYVVSITISLGVITAINNKKFILPELTKPLIIYITFIVVAAIFADDFNPHSLWSWAGFIVGGIFFIALHQSGILNHNKQHIYLIIIISGLLQAIIGYLQYNSITLFGHYFTPAYAVGVFYQVNSFSSYLATTILAGLLLSSPIKFKLSYKIIIMIIIFISSYSLYLASSRTGLIGLIIGFIFIAYGRKNNSNKYLIPIWLFAITVVCGYLLAHLFTEGNIVGKISALGDIGGLSRRGLYQGAFELFLENPIFGGGIGTFTANFHPFYVDVMEKIGNNNIIDSTTSHPHNEILYRLAESGIVGTIGLFIIAIYVLRMLIGLGKKGWVVAGIIFPLLLHTQTEYPMYQSAIHWTMFLLVLSIISKNSIKSIKLDIKNIYSKIIIFITIIATLFVIAFLMEKTSRSMDMHKGITWAYKDSHKPLKPFLENLLQHNLKDNYFSDASNRLILFSKSEWLQSGISHKDSKIYLTKLNKAYKYFPTASYLHLKVFALISQNKFSEANKIIKKAKKLYPNYTKKSQTERVLLQKWISASKNNTHKDVFQQYIDWFDSQKIKLSSMDYNFMIFSLHQTGNNIRGIELLTKAKKLYPKTKVFKNWGIK